MRGVPDSVETWLKTNPRPWTLAAALCGTLAAGLMFAAAWAAGRGQAGWGVLAGGAAAIAAVIGWRCWQQRQRPRLGYRDGCLLVFLGARQPWSIPVQLVEVFFLGQAPTGMTWRSREQQPKTRAIVVRLAEAAKTWHERDVPPALGRWGDGYITVLGTWCEPIRGDVVQSLNHRLVAKHRELRAATAEKPS